MATSEYIRFKKDTKRFLTLLTKHVTDLKKTVARLDATAKSNKPTQSAVRGTPVDMRIGTKGGAVDLVWLPHETA